MNPGKLHIEPIRAKDLYNFIRSYAAEPEGQLISPISVYRAQAQANNPYANEEDVGLLVAYAGKMCVGYQGLFPGLLRAKCGETKVYWCTAAYVLPEFRKRMVAIQLIKKILSLQKDIVVTGFDGVVGSVFTGMHFRELPPLNYLRVRLERLNLPARVMGRLSQSAALAPLFPNKVGDTSGRPFWLRDGIKTAYYKLATGALVRPNGERWREAGPSENAFVSDTEAKKSEAFFKRGPEIIRWMLGYPWIKTRSVTTPPFYFSEACPEFRYACFVSTDTSKEPSFAVLSLCHENGIARIKLLDYDEREEKRGEIFALVLREAAKFRADEIELPAEMEFEAKKLRFSSAILEHQKRRYLYHTFSPESPLATAIANLRLNYCDGDCAFT